jgi:hypothetical protein
LTPIIFFTQKSPVHAHHTISQASLELLKSIGVNVSELLPSTPKSSQRPKPIYYSHREIPNKNNNTLSSIFIDLSLSPSLQRFGIVKNNRKMLEEFEVIEFDEDLVIN